MRRKREEGEERKRGWRERAGKKAAVLPCK
jgi:hypothetical protein